MRTEKDQNERSRDLGKPKENEEQQRHRDGRRSLTEDWIRAEQTKGRYCIKKHDQQSKDGAVVKKVNKARVKKTKEQKKIIRLNDSSIDVLLRKLLVALKG